MYTQVMMPLQVNLTTKSGELTNSIVNTFWPKTPQQNKYRQIMQDKNSNKKKRHLSEQLRHPTSSIKTPSTPASSLVNKTQLQSSPFYAGAKFSEAPLPSFLPKPPTEWIKVDANLDNLNELTSLNDNLNQLNNNLNEIINSAANTNLIEGKIEILEKTNNLDGGQKAEETTKQLKQVNEKTYFSKYYEKKQRSTSASEFVVSTFQYNFRNTRRNTPQCQTKCKINRYSSFSRQNIHQKIAAVN